MMDGTALGKHVSTHKGNFSGGGSLWHVGGFLVVASLFGMFRVGILEGLGAALVAAVVLLVPLLRLRQRVDVYERGLVWARLTGTTTLRAEEVRSAELISHESRLKVRIRRKDGRALVIHAIDGAEQVRNFASAWTTPPTEARRPATSTGWVPPAQVSR